MAIVRTLCGQCPVGCGIRAVTGEGRELSFAGDPVHPANSGQLCAKSGAIEDMAPLDGRLLHPMAGGRRAGWDRAIAQIARRLASILARHGPDSVALYVPGNLLTEDYYAANKMMKGFIGSAHIDAGWRSDDVEGAYRAALGEDVAPGTYEDIDAADIILLTDAAAVERYPIVMDRIQAAREERAARLVVLASGGKLPVKGADLTVTVAAGTQGALLNGLLVHCHDSGALDREFLDRSVDAPPGFWHGLRAGHDLWSVARRCGLAPAELRAFYDLLGASGRVVTLHQGGRAGSGELARAVLNLHLAMGWIGRKGAAPMPLPAAPNAMGGREAGCFSGELAAHMDFSAASVARAARFWGGRTMAAGPGLEGGALAEAIGAGRIKALWMLGGMPPAGHALHGLVEQVPFTILSTPWAEPQLKGQQVIMLPSPVWAEKDGTLTGADRLISRQRRIFSLPGEAKPDWWSVTRVSQAMGWGDAFHYDRPAEIYREYARLTAYQNEGGRLLNLRRHGPISNPAYDELTPWRWGEIPFDGGRFPTDSGRARLLFN